MFTGTQIAIVSSRLRKVLMRRKGKLPAPDRPTIEVVGDSWEGPALDRYRDGAVIPVGAQCSMAQVTPESCATSPVRNRKGLVRPPTLPRKYIHHGPFNQTPPKTDDTEYKNLTETLPTLRLV
eukprot:sb/3475828/